MLDQVQGVRQWRFRRACLTPSNSISNRPGTVFEPQSSQCAHKATVPGCAEPESQGDAPTAAYRPGDKLPPARPSSVSASTTSSSCASAPSVGVSVRQLQLPATVPLPGDACLSSDAQLTECVEGESAGPQLDVHQLVQANSSTSSTVRSFTRTCRRAGSKPTSRRKDGHRKQQVSILFSPLTSSTGTMWHQVQQTSVGRTASRYTNVVRQVRS